MPRPVFTYEMHVCRFGSGAFEEAVSTNGGSEYEKDLITNIGAGMLERKSKVAITFLERGVQLLLAQELNIFSVISRRF